MNITHARVDDRLIHGQITTVWSKHLNVVRIIVIDDKVSQDVLRKTLLEQAAPPGINVHVLPVDRFLKIYANPKYSKDRVLLIFENIHTAGECIEKGVDIKSLNLGGVSSNRQRTKVMNHIAVTEDEANVLRKLAEQGIELDSRVVVTDRPEDLLGIINKIDFK